MVSKLAYLRGSMMAFDLVSWLGSRLSYLSESRLVSDSASLSGLPLENLMKLGSELSLE